MHNVFCIEDSLESQLILKKALSKSAIRLHQAHSLAEAKAMIAELGPSQIDLIVLDLSLPDGDGLILLDELQNHEILRLVPVFLMTGKSDLTSKIAAFSLGADDYLVKPVEPLELKVRIEMRLRKSTTAKQTSTHFRKGRLILQTSLLKAFIVKDEGQEAVDLTSKEFKILSLLAQGDGQAFSRSRIVSEIWGKTVHVLDRTVDSHICGLRKKLGPLANCISCIPGVGYRFVAELETASAGTMPDILPDEPAAL